jgi:cation diffusion facilitator CzcD-associated flavoprotein CzcO
VRRDVRLGIDAPNASTSVLNQVAAMEMSDYAAVLALSPSLDRDGLRKLARLACLALYRVSWLRAYLASDGTRMLCWYQAPDAEAVRFVLRQQGSQAVVWRCEVRAPADTEPAELGGDFTVVEVRAGTALGTAAVTSARDATVSVLGAAGHRVARVFMARSGAQLACLVEARDAKAVRTCLQAAGITPGAVWCCVALEPESTSLFRSSEAAPHDQPHVSPRVRPSVDPPDHDYVSLAVDAVVIGAGLSGICALHRLLGMGLSVRLYEAGSDVGGVWHWNRYPGARVDSESYTYGFSFSEEVLAEWQWQELFAAQPEVADYLRFVVDRLDLRRHMRLSTRVARAHYDGTRSCWRVETDAGERVTARYLVAATGVLSAAQLPDYPGIDDFAGESYHTARWPLAGVELSARRVGVIGTGASGVQVIQTIAQEVRHLTVFQRTPTYCIPQRNRPLTDADRSDIARDWAAILATCRASYGGFVHDFDPRAGLALSAAARQAKFEVLWEKPGFAFWFGNFGDLMMNAEVNAHASEFVRRKISTRVHDPEVVRKLLPDHPFGTKRVPLEHGYYEVFNRSNVRLVDLRETPIAGVTQTGIRTTREEHPLDVIIYATGFDAGTGALTRIDIRGEAGQSLADKWRDGPKTYLGLLVSGFPNLFIVNGPQNAAALCNAGRCIEQNVDWIARCIQHLRARGMRRIAPTAAAEEEWTEHVEEVAETTVLRLNTDSWFFGANTPGKARRAGIYAAGAREYRERCEEAAQAGYPGCTMA